MDKSEGTDFLSRTFGSISEKIAKLYHTGQKQVSLSSLKKMKTEKLNQLGNKVFQLIDEKKPLNSTDFKDEYASIVELIDAIEEAKKDIEKLKTSIKDDANNFQVTAVKNVEKLKNKATRKVKGLKDDANEALDDILEDGKELIEDGKEAVAKAKSSMSKASSTKVKATKPAPKAKTTKPKAKVAKPKVKTVSEDEHSDI